MNDDRDTHFAGFAAAQIDDLTSLFANLHYAEETYNSEQVAACRQAILIYLAQHAYDLVYHDHMNIEHIDLDRLSLEEQVARIPDLTEWPTQ